MNTQKTTSAFSLVEILVAVSVLMILSGMVYVSVDRALAKTRDAQRIEDLQKIAKAIDIWYFEKGRDPGCVGGTVIEETSSPRVISTDPCAQQTEFLDFLRERMGKLPTDPLGPDNNDYYYYFDPSHPCTAFTGTSTNASMVFAANMEVADSNVLERCTTQTGNDGGFVNTTAHSGTKNPSKPHAVIVDRKP